MKKICLFFAAFCLIFSGCGKESVPVTITDVESGFSLSCDGYSDSYETQLSVSESAELTVSVAVKATSGSLAIDVLDSAGESVYHGDNINANGNAVIRLLGPNTYTLTIAGSKFVGKCTITWDTIGALANSAPPLEVDIINPSPQTSNSPSPPPQEVESTESTEAIESTTVLSPVTESVSISWSGVFLREDGAVSISLYQRDSELVEFDVVTDTEVLNDYATVSQSDKAVCTYENEAGAGIRVTLTKIGLTVEATGTGEAFSSSVAGNYVRQ